MSSSKKKRNNPNKKGELRLNWPANLYDFHEKLSSIGTSGGHSSYNKQGREDVSKLGQTREVCTLGNSMTNLPENFPSTSGTSHKQDQTIKLGPSMGHLSDTNKMNVPKQTSSLSHKNNKLDSSPQQPSRNEPAKKGNTSLEIKKKRKKRSKGNASKVVKTDMNLQVSKSADHLRIANEAQATQSSSLGVQSNSSIEKNLTLALFNKYKPCGLDKTRSSSEIMNALAGLNPENHCTKSGNTSVSAKVSGHCKFVEDSLVLAALQSVRRRQLNASRYRRVSVNIPHVSSKQNLSQSELVNRYNRAHREKVRDLKEEAPKKLSCIDPRFASDRKPTDQGCDYLGEEKPYAQPCAIKRLGSSAVEHTSPVSRVILPTRPLSASRFNPPPAIYFKSTNVSSMPSSSTEVQSDSLLPDLVDSSEYGCMEWEDIEDDKVLQNIKDHRQWFQGSGNLNDTIEDMDTNCLYVSGDNSGDCFIVLDTNILISHLKFVMELSKQEYKVIGCPILIIPWMVLKELDTFKGGSKVYKVHDTKLQAKARSAVNFINGCFSSHHPRIKGQSALDYKDHCIPIDVPDDSILNCCLQLKMKGKRVILLSNDVNFCNKAMATGILSYGKEQMSKAVILGKFDFDAVQSRSLLSEPNSLRTEAEKQYDQTVVKFKVLLQEFLSKFCETEMKRVWKKDWIKIIHLKPPWSLLDSLRNLSRHWIAVFGFIMHKSGQKVIEKLISALKTEGSSAGSPPVEAEDVVLLAVELCDTIISDNYQPLALEYKNSFMSTLKVLKECKTGDIRGASGDQACPETVTHFTQSPAYQSDKCTVFETFQFMWNLVNNFCGVVCDTFGIEHKISYEKPENFPTLEEVRGRLPEASHYVSTIITCLISVLEIPEAHLSVEHPTIRALHTLIQSMVPSEFLANKGITCEKLLLFCIDKSTRAMLMNGLTQFQGAQSLLLKILNFIEMQN